jgi:hypothetical protein
MTFNKSDFFASNGLPRTGADSAVRVTKTAKGDFGLNKPKTATPGPPPVIEDTAGRQQDEADRIRMRKGRASAILTPGGAGTPLTAAKTLLGG